ncbi:MAG: class I SAM-dependent methyltransferase [Pseudomonadota bacterium]
MINPRTAKAVWNTLWGTGLTTQVRLAVISHAKANDGYCPCCGYRGKFRPFGMPVRTGVMCPRCSSLERHRLLALAASRQFFAIADRRVLHFAAELPVMKIIKSLKPASYHRSSYPDSDADYRLDIHAIDLPDESVDVVICSHILEHVDDRRALSEIARILSPGGQLIAMVPLIEGWEQTYENADIDDDRTRELHFGQYDHIRYYGRDFRERLTHGGFDLKEFTADGRQSVDNRLMRGEKVFLGTKRTD